MGPSDSLPKIQAYTSIFSSIAVPVLIATFGWLIQTQTSEEGVKKDYVQMALTILNAEKGKADDDMRSWAIAVLDKNSPVPFSKGLKENLSKGNTTLINVGYKLPPAVFMDPPKELIPLDSSKHQITSGDLLLNTVQNYGICNENSLRLSSLQKLLKEYDKIYNKNIGEGNVSKDN